MNCSFCGKELDELDRGWHYPTGLGPAMLDNGTCFTCEFWREQSLDRSNALVVGGTQYRLGPEDARDMRGFSGNRWTIEFLDGSGVVTSTNLWCQGKVPAAWLPMLPDSARFL